VYLRNVTFYFSQITRLKIASNPFAKGFREASRTRYVWSYTTNNRTLCISY